MGVRIRRSARWGWDASYEYWSGQYGLLGTTLWRPTQRWACRVATRRNDRATAAAKAAQPWENC